jgi:hypothetical protein
MRLTAEIEAVLKGNSAQGCRVGTDSFAYGIMAVRQEVSGDTPPERSCRTEKWRKSKRFGISIAQRRYILN